MNQGAVLSPILFTMYIDGLFYELKRAGVGCLINGEFSGACGDADDMVMSPSLNAFNIILLFVKTMHTGLIYNK